MWHLTPQGHLIPLYPISKTIASIFTKLPTALVQSKGRFPLGLRRPYNNSRYRRIWQSPKILSCRLTGGQLQVVGPTYVKNVTYEFSNMFKKITGDPGPSKLSKLTGAQHPPPSLYGGRLLVGCLPLGVDLGGMEGIYTPHFLGRGG